MALDLTYDLSTGDGRDLDILKQTIELRKKELGNTTKQSVIAIAINTLKSLRRDTKVANENKGNIEIKDLSDKYIISFAGIKGSKKRKLAIRDNAGNSITLKQKIVPYSQNIKTAKIFAVTDYITDDKKIQYVIIADSSELAREKAMSFHKNRVQEHKGLAKIALSIATYLLSQSGNVEQGNQNTNAIAHSATSVNVIENGFDSGDIQVSVHDRLNYASDALKGGASSVQMAINKSCNQILGYLASRLKKEGRINDSLAIKDIIQK